MMEGTKETSALHEWSDLICSLLQNGQSVAVGIFSLEGRLLEANPAMCYFLNTNRNELKPQNAIVNPEFSTFIKEPKEDLIFQGIMTIGNFRDISYVFDAKVYRKNDLILVYAEGNIPVLFEENKRMSLLNQEINNLQRQLIKEKKTLQITLNELKETQQMLIHAEKMNALGKLVAGVAHEINNPIAFVYSNQFALERYMNEVFETVEQINQIIEQIDQTDLRTAILPSLNKNRIVYLKADIFDIISESKVGIDRVKTIVRDLQRFSRADESAKKQIDLIENIRSAISIVKAEINRKNIDFRLDCPDNLSLVCYPGQLNQAILNVLINAIYAVENKGQITMTVLEETKNVSIAVKDDGNGIPDEIKDRIFDPFFTTKPVGSGTGLGLSITYKIIVDLHKGTIGLQSTAGQGTFIKFVIPK